MDGAIHCEDGSDEIQGFESTATGCMSNELSAGKFLPPIAFPIIPSLLSSFLTLEVVELIQ